MRGGETSLGGRYWDAPQRGYWHRGGCACMWRGQPTAVVAHRKPDSGHRCCLIEFDSGTRRWQAACVPAELRETEGRIATEGAKAVSLAEGGHASRLPREGSHGGIAVAVAVAVAVAAVLFSVAAAATVAGSTGRAGAARSVRGGTATVRRGHSKRW